MKDLIDWLVLLVFFIAMFTMIGYIAVNYPILSLFLFILLN